MRVIWLLGIRWHFVYNSLARFLLDYIDMNENNTPSDDSSTNAYISHGQTAFEKSSFGQSVLRDAAKGPAVIKTIPLVELVNHTQPNC